ncbi:preprotein translocase subunit SecD [Methylohalomonas lacus]|uniref:Protein translocase subunit SecD n=1 Tax=Methylohalomonas lacus TaxID=398773 RepID=A0AAE3L4U1_9GAMM|nr:protein translocase subunit SecD [Methylohalomonas lacus]MCS3902217.1 preprotein translocase subunit SecD [Methylohalomonas lacus]
MNRYPLWKYLLLLIVVLVGAVYALPNLFGKDPAIQVSPTSGEVSELTELEVTGVLDEAGITPTAVERQPDSLILRFADSDAQLEARDHLLDELGRSHTVALNLAPATPDWLRSLNAEPMFLGLDLRGGVHFLLQVDMEAAIDKAEERYVSDIRALLREERVRYKSVREADDGGVELVLRDQADSDKTASLVSNNFLDLNVEEADAEYTLRATLSEQSIKETRDFALQQNITTLRKRVNELGVAEPIIQQQGNSRIVVQLPGVQDTARAKDILGATATLEFRMVDTDNSVQDAVDGRVPAGSKLYYERNGSPVLLEREIMLTGDSITDASSGIEQTTGGPMVSITLDSKGSRIFSRRTADEVGNPMATVYIENKTVTERNDDDELVQRKETVEEVINIATIREQLGQRFQITGLESTQEARNLALLLRAGALAAPVTIIEERTIGPSLGQQNIDQGFMSVLIGFVLVLLFMAVYYRVFGLVANLALTLNLVLLVALLSLLQATLTLPGIAGIVLTVGMAVDANVLIFERIREEVRNGNSPQSSIHAGYEKAFSSIADANITTLIAAVVLFSFGTGPVKGFAVTLSLGILCSMFTAIFGTRAVINLIYGGRRLSSISI